MKKDEKKKNWLKAVKRYKSLAKKIKCIKKIEYFEEANYLQLITYTNTLSFQKLKLIFEVEKKIMTEFDFPIDFKVGK